MTTAPRTHTPATLCAFDKPGRCDLCGQTGTVHTDSRRIRGSFVLVDYCHDWENCERRRGW